MPTSRTCSRSFPVRRLPPPFPLRRAPPPGPPPSPALVASIALDAPCRARAEWLAAGSVQKLVVVVTGQQTQETLERWVFDVHTDKSVGPEGKVVKSPTRTPHPTLTLYPHPCPRSTKHLWAYRPPPPTLSLTRWKSPRRRSRQRSRPSSGRSRPLSPSCRCSTSRAPLTCSSTPTTTSTCRRCRAALAPCAKRARCGTRRTPPTHAHRPAPPPQHHRPLCAQAWEESDPRYIANSDEVKLRSFTTKVHRVDACVSYKADA